MSHLNGGLPLQLLCVIVVVLEKNNQLQDV